MCLRVRTEYTSMLLRNIIPNNSNKKHKHHTHTHKPAKQHGSDFEKTSLGSGGGQVSSDKDSPLVELQRDRACGEYPLEINTML